MSDLYQILGVSKNASASDIKSAYRKLAKKLHPDVNPGRKDIEQKFKEVTAAYDLLSDPDKRARYDRGDIDAQGQERGFGGFGGNHSRSSRSYHQESSFSNFDINDFFAEFMGGGKNKRSSSGFGNNESQSRGPRGSDVTYKITVSFNEACLGGKKRVTLTNDKTVDITIPVGTEDGHKLRLKGQGLPGIGGNAGDAIVEIQVSPHPFFVRKDKDIHLECPISLQEAVLGGSVNVPTLEGQVAVKIPKGANSGTMLRLQGKGINGGNMLIKLKVVLPDPLPADLTSLVEKWSKKHSYNPRKGAGWE